MKIFGSLTLLYTVSPVLAVYHRNLAYSSPFALSPELSLLEDIEARLTKRQSEDNIYNDQKYPTFYGADFAASPTVWSGGVNFTHSGKGDPWDTSVILWTRAAPANNGSPDPSVPICVWWRITHDPSGDMLDHGEAFTSYDVDWTVKVEASNLSPDTKYVYQFSDCTNKDNSSPVGKTRTLPSPDAESSTINSGNPLTFSVFSCSQWQAGYFNAYGIAAHNVSTDFYIHLGDYIYEYDNNQRNGDDIGRSVTGRECATIADYRERLALYRTDPYLLAAHEDGPWITVWDDHEVADNTWKAGTNTSDDTPEGCQFSVSGACFTDRKWAAVRAYHEWMPIRQVDAGDMLRIWRNFQLGKLLDLTMLDTRIYDRDVTDVIDIGPIADYENRSIMGTPQEKWFLDTLDESVSRGAIWRILTVATLLIDKLVNYDQWDGYRANRGRIYDHLYDNDISNLVILAGDSHSNWVSDLSRPNASGYDPITGQGAVGVEFAVTAVTSPSHFGNPVPIPQANAYASYLTKTNEDLQWAEVAYRGFYTLTLNAQYANVSYYCLNDINTPNLNAFACANFTVEAGANRLQRPVAGGHVDAGVLKPTS
ncbi:PhoD-like phosphatase-domain-containing protein [Flagelloscypha sp. PMI_526]|nr:PhoD-like phosphatase-domain-containing protein [Flagelloscypha sp. PMI_526]